MVQIRKDRLRDFLLDCLTVEYGTEVHPETLVTNYQSKKRKITEKLRSRPLPSFLIHSFLPSNSSHTFNLPTDSA